MAFSDSNIVLLFLFSSSDVIEMNGSKVDFVLVGHALVGYKSLLFYLLLSDFRNKEVV
jgi:hypothetical protein